MHHLAEHFPALVGVKHVGSAGIYSIDWYIYFFVLWDVIDEAAVAANYGYSRISKDSYYLINGNTTERSKFRHRKRLCGCDPCMNLNWVCLLTPINYEREASTTPLLSINKINPKQTDYVAAQTRQTRNPFNEFQVGLTIGENLSLIIHPEEMNVNPNDVYFIGNVV